MYLWMSTGLPFNATFNYMRRLTLDAPSQHADDSMDPLDVPQGSTAPQRTARHGYSKIIFNIYLFFFYTSNYEIHDVKQVITFF